jgi:uncharacterized protein (TIGR00297 family)
VSDLAALGLFSALLLGAVGAGEGLRALAGWRPEASRRAVHAGVGLATAACPPLFSEPAYIYALAAGFLAFNLVAVRRRWLPAMHGVRRRTWGTVTFPLALIVALGLCWSLDPGRVYVLQTAFAVLALADPAASAVGEWARRPGRYTVGGAEKSLAGSAAFAVVAALVTAAMLTWLGPRHVGVWQVVAGALVVGGVGAAAEALGRAGWDNLLIVLAVVVPLSGLDRQPGAAGVYLVGLGLAVAFGVAAYRARSLDLSGALAATVLAWMVFALGGAAWAVPAVLFFVLSSGLSRVGRARKAAAEALAQKGSRRDAGQVAANGGVGAALLAAFVFAPEPALYWGFVGAFAAAAADTWGTEVGTLVGGPTRRLGLGRPVPPGTSGGVSLAGTAGACAGALVVAASAVPFAGPYALAGSVVGPAALAAAAGVAAAFLDSALGATVQARFRAPSGALTERARDGARALPLAAGLRWVDNDRVNLACTLAGGLLPLLLFL